MASVAAISFICASLVYSTSAQFPLGGYPHGAISYGPFGGLVPLNGFCSISSQCYGSAVCLSQRCGCASGYIQSGVSCVSQTIGVSAGLNLGYPMAFGGGFGYPSLGGYYGAVGGLAQIGASSSSVVYVDPGTSCSGTSMCGGGSYCFQSTCSCPTGQIVVGTSCVAQTAGILSPFAGGVTGCPTGLVFVGSSCIPQTFIQSLPTNYLCSSGCTGGATCLNGLCSCPGGMSWTNGVCSTMQTTSIGSFGLGSAALLGPSIFSGPSVVNYPGLPYGSSFTSTSVVALGSPCLQTSQCGSGSWCHVGVCSCQASFVQMGTTCVRRRKAKEINTEIVPSQSVQTQNGPEINTSDRIAQI